MKENYKPQFVDLDANDQAARQKELDDANKPLKTQFGDNYHVTNLSSIGETAEAKEPAVETTTEAAAEKTAGRFEGIGQRMDTAFENGAKFVGGAQERMGRFFNKIGARISSGAAAGFETVRSLAEQGITSFNAWKDHKKEQIGNLVQKGAAAAESVRNAVQTKSKEAIAAGKQALENGYNGLRSFGTESVAFAGSAIMGAKERVRDGYSNMKIELAKEMAARHAEQAARHTEAQAHYEKMAETIRRAQSNSALRSRFAARARAANDNGAGALQGQVA